MAQLEFIVGFKGEHPYVDVIDKRRLTFLEATVQFLIDDALAESQAVDATDSTTVTVAITTIPFADFRVARERVQIWLAFVQKERGGGIDPADAVGVTQEIIFAVDEVRFEMKRGATVLTEGICDLVAQLVIFDSTFTIALSFSELLLWNQLLNNLASTIEAP